MKRLIPLKWIRFYPPFFFLSLKPKIYNNGKSIKLTIPFRRLLRNNNGVMFGGALLMLSDPFPALLFEELIDGVKAWTVAHSIEYLKPIRSRVEAEIHISETDIMYFEEGLKTNKSCEKQFEYYFTDKKGRKVAKVTTTALVRKIA